MVALQQFARFHPAQHGRARQLPQAQRWPRAELLQVAGALCNLLADFTTRCAAAGSLRRHAETAAGVEIVAQPRYEQARNIFDEPVGTADLLDLAVYDLLSRGVLQTRLDHHGGRRHGGCGRCLVYRDRPVDLVSVPLSAQWGPIHLLRTGPPDFGKRLVSPVKKGGWCPDVITWRNGRLWRFAHADPLHTPEEADVFRALGLPYLRPEHRTSTVCPLRSRHAGVQAVVWCDPETRKVYNDAPPGPRLRIVKPHPPIN